MIKFKEIFEQLVEDHTCINCGNIVDENLKQWFKDRWVNIGKKKKGGGHPPCGTSGKKRGYAKCVPAAKAARMTDKQKKSATTRKRRAQTKLVEVENNHQDKEKLQYELVQNLKNRKVKWV